MVLIVNFIASTHLKRYVQHEDMMKILNGAKQRTSRAKEINKVKRYYWEQKTKAKFDKKTTTYYLGSKLRLEENFTFSRATKLGRRA